MHVYSALYIKVSTQAYNYIYSFPETSCQKTKQNKTAVEKQLVKSC